YQNSCDRASSPCCRGRGSTAPSAAGWPRSRADPRFAIRPSRHSLRAESLRIWAQWNLRHADVAPMREAPPVVLSNARVVVEAARHPFGSIRQCCEIGVKPATRRGIPLDVDGAVVDRLEHPWDAGHQWLPVRHYCLAPLVTVTPNFPHPVGCPRLL